LNKVWLPILVFLCAGCAKTPVATGAPPDQGPILKVRGDLADGNYDKAIKACKEITSQVPPSPCAEEALYLEAYAMAFGRSDDQGARLPLRQLLDFYPSGKYAPDAQRLLADCHYWVGSYQTAYKEYQKLSGFPDKGLQAYARLQMANCLFLEDKVGDALSAYRGIVQDDPADPVADSAQLMIVNSFVKLQNLKEAKKELQKLISLTQNSDIQQEARKALRQMEEEEPFRKGVDVQG
jgi:TolA-binding protein